MTPSLFYIRIMAFVSGASDSAIAQSESGQLKQESAYWQTREP